MNKLTHFYLLILISCLTIYVSDANSADYKLGPGDKIEISVFGEKDLSISVLLGNSGKINYPFLGEISLVGLSVKQVENMIVRGLKGDYLINPNVSAYVSKYQAKCITYSATVQILTSLDIPSIATKFYLRVLN